MSDGRVFHTATLLSDGRVLVAGGLGEFKTADIYDPATGSWTPAGSLTEARHRHSATLLLDGKVIIAGGIQGGVQTGPSATVELFDPDTTAWYTP